MKCPRCGSTNVVLINLEEKNDLEEYYCYGECFEKNISIAIQHDYIYFQYSKFANDFCWPAIGVMYKCHAEDLQAVKDGKIIAEII